ASARVWKRRDGVDKIRSMSSAVNLTRGQPSADLDSLNARWPWYFGGALLATAVLYFARLGARALWASEFRWAEIAREMLLTHNYFWPTLNGRVYFDKPLGTYWLVIGSTWITGAMNEMAARIPCAVAGLLAVAFLMLLARRLYDAKAALLAGVVLATSYSFVFFSRTASADVETIAGELAALLLFFRYERQPGPGVIWLWVVMAITSQMKGLLGFVLPILVIGSYCCLADGWSELGQRILYGPIANRLRWLLGRNSWLFNRWSLVAIPLGIALYYLPFAISDHIQGSPKGLQMVFRENVVRFFHPFDHRGPIYLYVYVIFLLMAPWAMLLPAALVEAHRRVAKTRERADRLALVYFWATFAFFTLSGSRRDYYILPILPAGALLVGRLLTQDAIDSLWARRLTACGFGVIASGTLVAIALLVPPRLILRGPLAALPPLPDRAVFVVCWFASVGAVLYALRGYSPRRVALSTAVIAYLMLVYLNIFALPAAEVYRGEKEFGLQIRLLLRGDLSKVAFYNTEGPLFYMNPPQPIPQFDQLGQLKDALGKGQLEWLVTRRSDLDQVRGTVRLTESSYPWETEEQTRNRGVLVELPKP
ncbi:MAG TPA: glycosyltransferase family 39 protein, partial [Candidatus Binataceae bacterium]|nr:glycosyltransferase family 39 protein [Candidatus Binataceae bacterium]